MANLEDKRIAIIALDYFEEAELVRPRDELAGMGAEVKVYSKEAGEIQAMQHVDKSITVPVDGTFEDLDVAEIDGLIVPGGAVNADQLRVDEDAQRILTEAIDRRILVAIICHGPWLLVSAGLAEDRRMTSYYTLKDDIENAGGEWADEEVIVDDNLITSRNPDDLPVFISTIAAALEDEADEELAEDDAELVEEDEEI
jgi:protease I